MSKPLEGIKVVDLSTFVAAPVCCRLLADLGAQVIKVERPEGDTWRATGKSYIPSRFSDEENPVFDIFNSGKEHIALNLKTPEGMEVMHKLLSQADVFVTNTRPAALRRLGIFYDDIKERYPSLVYGIVLGYGEKGPDKDMPAFDTTAFWARSGFLRDQSLLKEDYSPVMPPFGVGDTVTGMFLMGEICAALVRRLKTGKGDYVSTGLYHNSIFTMGTMNIITQAPFGRPFPVSRIDHDIPGGAYQCADGEWVFIATSYAPILIPKLCQAIGKPELATDERFDTPAKRWTNRAEYYAIFRDAFLTQPYEYWERKSHELDFPLMRMNHYSDVTKDEQAWANGYLEHVEFANGRVDIMPSSPIEMESLGTIPTKPAPAIGADTKRILQDLGYSDEAIEGMCQSGAVAAAK